MDCGSFNIRELAGSNRTHYYMYNWWENIDFSVDVKQPLYKYLKKSRKFCFVYLDE